MVQTHKMKGFALFGTVALAVTGLALAANAAPFPKDTVVTSYADNNGNAGDPQIVMLTKGADPTGYATVDPGSDRAWLAPIAFGPDGHLYLVMATKNGTLLDISAGGDLTSATVKPIASGFFPALPHKTGGIAFDAEGNAYVTLESTEDENSNGADPNLTMPIARINLKTGAKSTINGMFNHAKGLVVRADPTSKDEILYIAEENTGKILAYDLTTDKLNATPFATGFPPITDHGMAALAFDQRGHLMATWRMDPNDNTTGAVFDVSAGGDFSNMTKTPPLLTGFPFSTDENGLIFDSKNNMYIGGDNHFTFVSQFDATKGKWGDFSQYANDNLGGDCESVAIAP